MMERLGKYTPSLLWVILKRQKAKGVNPKQIVVHLGEQIPLEYVKMFQLVYLWVVFFLWDFVNEDKTDGGLSNSPTPDLLISSLLFFFFIFCIFPQKIWT